MSIIWMPKDLNATCSHQQAPLMECSPTGYMLLSLVTQLFGSVSYSITYTGFIPYPNETFTQSISTSPKPPMIPTMLNNTINPTHQANDQNVSTQSLPYLNRFGNEDILRLLHPELPYNSSGYTNYTDPQITRPVIAENSKDLLRTQRITEEYDFIIIGGGSAGCVLANRLSEVRQWNILLLEAGPEEPDITMVPSFPPLLKQSSIDWNYRTQPENLTCRGEVGHTCSWPRGKTLGGSSAINYLVYMRGNQLDYDGWAEMGNPGWSYDEILPYFKKSENNRNIEGNDTVYHGVGGPLNVERFPYTDANTLMLIEAFQERGLPLRDLTLPNNLGVNLAQSTSLNGRRFSANLAYIRPIRNVRPNLNIIVNAFVTKVIIDPKTKITQGVTYIKNGAYINVYAKREVIVSAGALNSPKILMLSGVGPKQHLQSLNIQVIENLKVGRNLQDHATTIGFSIAFSNKTLTTVNSSQLFNEIINYRKQNIYNKGPLATTSTLNAVAFIKTKYSTVNAPDIQFHFVAADVEELYADPQSYIESSLVPLSFCNGVSINAILLAPKSRGHVEINPTDPVFGQPMIYPGFFTEKIDLDTLVEGMRFSLTLEQTEAFKHNGASIVKTPIKGCEQYVWGSYEYFSCLLIQYTATIFHPAGTCKMGPSWDENAVVDSRLRVYGIKHLRVIDASIMPTIVRGNTNAPTMMIGERASDMIKEDWMVSVQ